MARASVALAFALAGALAGCGGSHSTAPIVQAPHLPVGTPGNTAPDSTVMRWIAAYAAKSEPEYDGLLTSDFHYHFSVLADPTLVTQYGNNWGLADETASYHHLLHGFKNSGGVDLPPASDISGALTNAYVYPDTTHPDSTDWYKIVDVLHLLIAIDVPSPEGATTYDVSLSAALLLVRGDAAVLSAGQDHSATRWYIRECDDYTALFVARRKGPATEIPLPAASSTWGDVRALYR